MTQPTEKDIEKIKQLRGYYTREYDLKTDIEFMQWISEAMKIIRAADYQRVKATFEKRSDTDTIYTCPTCGARHEDGGRGKPPVYCDECGADWK